MTSTTPLRIQSLGPCQCDALVWQHKGALGATIVVKAAFALVHEQSARVIEPVQIAHGDVHYEGNPACSVEMASDMAPYLPRAGVTLVGHASAPHGKVVPEMRVRL